MMILSMDLGKSNTACCFYDTRTRKHRSETIATKRSHVEQRFASKGIGPVAMEACGPSGWISDICHEKKLATLVCSTNDEAWAWKNTKRKTDRDDALKLARMAMLLECAWASTRYNRWSKLTFARIHGGAKTRRKKQGSRWHARSPWLPGR